MDGKQEYEEVVRHGLQVAVDGVECMGCKGGRYWGA